MFRKLGFGGEGTRRRPWRRLEDGNAGAEGRKSELSPIITDIRLNDFCLIISAIPRIARAG
jgi:hypothetical protein